LFELLDDLTERIKIIESWLEEKASQDKKVQLLLTHKRIGLLSALAVVHTLGVQSRSSKLPQCLNSLSDFSSCFVMRLITTSTKGVARQLGCPLCLKV
jgi:hypothetical protein